MPTALSLLLVAAALAMGATFAWFLREREVGMLRSAVAEQRARSNELAAQLTQAEGNLGAARASLAAANERLAALQQVEEKLRGEFAVLAKDALDSASRTFLELASAKLGEERQSFAGSISTRVEEIKGVLGPVQIEFAKFSTAVDELKKNSSHDLGTLKSSLEHVVQIQAQLQEAVRMTNTATGQLRTALQNPHVAGSWGQIGLRRIVELAGMLEHCDFDEQVRARSGNGTIEVPDLVVHLTGGLNVPLDAKAPLTNYLRANEAPDETERDRLLKLSVGDLRKHVDDVRKRAYDHIEGYAGMTLLFVANESMLSSALGRDPGLLEDAMAVRIVVCSPLLLLCYLRAFAHGWSLQEQQKNAEEVARRGKMLHDRLQKFFTALGKVGWYLNHTTEKFNDCVGKMDNLLVPAREMGRMLGLNDELQSVDAVATGAREVRSSDPADATPKALIPA